MRIQTLFYCPHRLIVLFTFTLFMLCTSASLFVLSAQTHKLSKKELRIALIDSIYHAAILNGLDPKDPLQYDFFFTDVTKKHIENLKEKLLQDSFEIIRFGPDDYKTQVDKIWHLQTRKVKIY